MPISVTCPSCSATFSVKDEYAGKRAKCPKCAEPLTVPGGGATTPADRPKSSAIAKALDDEADDKPKAKRRRDEDEDEADEKPRAKKRRDDDEEEDEKPRAKKRRDGDDDENEDDRPRRKRRGGGGGDDPPKKKSNALVIVLGIVGGVLLLCGGGCAGVWFFVIKPAGERVASNLNAWASEVKQEQEFREKFQQVRAGMTKKEVEDLLGSNNTKALEHDVGRVTIGLSDWPQADDRWKPKAKLGHVLLWDKSGDGVLVAFSTDPNAGGTVVGTAGNFGLSGSEPVKLPAAVKPGDTKNSVAVATLLSDHTKYKGKTVEVKGVIQAAGALAIGGEAVFVERAGGLGLKMTFGPLEWQKYKLSAGDTVTVKGNVSGEITGGFVFMNSCDVIAHAPGTKPPPPTTTAPVAATADEMIRAFIKDENAPEKLYFGKQVKVTGIVVDVTRNDVFFGGTEANGFKHYVSVRMAGATGIKKGDTVTVVGKYFGYATDATNGVRTISLTDGKQDGGAAPPPPPPAEAMKVNSEILVLDFAQNADAAAKKYADKTLTVTGTVDKVSPTGMRVTLKGLAADGNKKAYVIDVGMGPAGRDEVKKLKEGDPVKLTGKYLLFRPASGTNPNTVVLTGGVLEK